MVRLPEATKFYIDGEWRAPDSSETAPLINPATETEIGHVALGNTNDANDAVAAAKRAFPGFSKTSVAERIDLLKAINDQFKKRKDEIANAVHQTMGAPIELANSAQAGSGLQHFGEIIKVLETFEFETPMGTTMVRKEPIGVCALITPWNWPVNQIATKVAPALAAGCTMVLKPSEYTPLDAILLTEILHDVGVPKGVFNLVTGTGAQVGAHLCAHPDIDFVSFTGSTRAGMAIGAAGAKDIKRVALELGGKSACILLDDANYQEAVPAAVKGVMLNSGQSCNAAARILAPRGAYEEICNIAKETANALTLGPEGYLGPVANAIQFEKVRDYIKIGLSEGARLIAGGADRPSDKPKGYYVSPTVLADVAPGSTLDREEIFGPVLTITPYDSIAEAIEIANDSEYGLSGAVWSNNHQKACEVASALRTRMVHINGSGLDASAPFGGYKKSGNGREWGVYGLEEFLELKSVYGGAAEI